MARVDVKVAGGDKLKARLSQIAANLQSGTVRVGFLEKATYPAKENGPSLHVAQVAFWNEFGTTRAPARPFFRNTVKSKSPGWGDDMAKIAQAQGGLSTAKILALMGERIKGQLVQAIVEWPADNAPSTAERKGFNKGLVDKGIMQRSVDYEVAE